MKEYPRHYRVADQVQRDLAEILRRDLKDPRVPTLLTLSSVEVTRDLSVATIYVTCLGEVDRVELLEILRTRAGFMRSLLGKRLRLRSVPELRFRYDDTQERAERIDQAIANALSPKSA